MALRIADKIKANGLVAKAIKNGAMERKTVCESCSESEREVVAHHPDYSKPLDVMWLCRKCHSLWHAKNGYAPTVDSPRLFSVRIYKAERMQAKIEAAQEEVDIADIIRGWRFAAQKKGKQHG